MVAAVLALDIGHAPQALVAPQMHDQHALTASMLAITLALAGLLAATKRPGWHILGLLNGAALIYLGLVAARLPSLPGSWGVPGTALATLGGWAFVGVTVWEMHLETRKVAQRSHADPHSNKTHG